MSRSPVEIEVKEKISKSSYYELYKQLEILNFKQLKHSSLKRKQSKEAMKKSLQFEGMFSVLKYKINLKLKSTYKSQYAAFHGATNILVIVGQCFGLNPVLGITESDTKNIRFKATYLRHFYSVILCIIQLIASILSFNSLIINSISVATLAYFTFYSTTFYTTLLFMRLARRWQLLNKEVSQSRLDEYIDPYIRPKCIAAIVVILSLAFLEHVLSLVSTFRLIMDCDESLETIFQKYIQKHFSGIQIELGTYYIYPVGFFVMITNLVCTMNWNYSHVFVICISLYLTSILEGVNKKLISTEGQCLSTSFWRCLREDYNNATKLVRFFDDYINSITLVAFASNMFFVCLQLFYILSSGYNSNKTTTINKCRNVVPGAFSGNEHVLYFCFSLSFVLARSLTVLLITSGVHTASLVAAPVLYTVPSPSYSIEVQRFIEQVHGDMVALTGMNFFYVTRELVLSVAGTIITYELVLLQFSVDDA